MVRFGAEMVFSSKDSTITDEDIDRIIAKGEEATAELDAKMKKFTEDAIQFKMDDSMLIYCFYTFSMLTFDLIFVLVQHLMCIPVCLQLLICMILKMTRQVHFLCLFFDLFSSFPSVLHFETNLKMMLS